MPKTLYVSDLDGTLLKKDKTLSDYTKAALNGLIKSGAAFTYATARSFSSASPLVSSIDIAIPAVTFNGVFIVDPKSGKHIIENIFSQKSLDAAKKFIRENSFAPIVYFYIDGRERVSYLESRLGEVSGYVSSRKGDERLRAVSSYKELFEGNVFYMTLFNVSDTEKCDSFFCEENGFSHNVQNDDYGDMVWYEIYSKNAGKEKAVLQLKELIKADSLVCFGDNLNDREMLKISDTGAAVENACEELKAIADVIIESCENDAVARFIERRENALFEKSKRLESAVGAAFRRVKGANGSVGTQNEKLIHSVLKNYYAPYSDEQEIKIGNYFADAVSEDGIFEIQSKQLYRLSSKLSEFLPAAKVNVVYPLVCESKTLFINEESGETYEDSRIRKTNSLLSAFEELYSIRWFLNDEALTIIITRLKIENHVYFSGEKLPDLRNRRERKKLKAEKVPVEIAEEIVLKCREDYRRFIPAGLSGSFTKKEFLKAAGDAKSSLRLEVLRTVGLIRQIGKKGREYLYITEEL